MVETGTLLLIIGLLVNLVAAPYYYRKLHRLIELLKVDYPDIYEEMGRPSLERLSYKTSASDSRLLTKYVRTKSYLLSNDEGLNLTGNKAFRGLITTYTAMSVMFIGFGLMLLSNGNV